MASPQRPNTSLLAPMETMGDHANDIARQHRAEAERTARLDLGTRPNIITRFLARVKNSFGRLPR